MSAARRRLAPAGSRQVVGCIFAAASACSYGVTIVLGRTLARSGVTSATALGFRFSVAACLALVLLAGRRAPLLPAPGERLAVVGLGAIGYATESTLFFGGLQRGTAAAAALLFYAYPAMVVLIELAMGWDVVRPGALAALALSAAGTVVVIGSGGGLAMSATGMAFALGAAFVFAVYLLVGSHAIRRTDALTRAAWVAFGAAVSSLGRGALTGTLAGPRGHVTVLLVYGAATAVAFALMFAALSRLGASRTAVVMTLEAFSAVVLAAAFLHEPITSAQLLGGAAILGAAAMIAGSRDAPRTPINPQVPPPRPRHPRPRPPRPRPRTAAGGWAPGQGAGSGRVEGSPVGSAGSRGARR